MTAHFVFYSYKGVTVIDNALSVYFLQLPLRRVILLCFIHFQHLLFKFLNVVSAFVFQLIFIAFFHFFLSFVVQRFDFLHLVYCEYVIVAKLLQKLSQQGSLCLCSSLSNALIQVCIQKSKRPAS